MNWYARFNRDVIDKEKEVNYVKNNNSKNTRYAILDENYTHYFICDVANKMDHNVVNTFPKSLEDDLFVVVEE